MKLIQVVNAHDVVDGFAEKENIGAHLAYTMTKFVVATQTDADFYHKEMQKIFEKYGDKLEDGKISIKSENVDAFQDSVERLQNTEASDPGIRFSLSEMANELKLSMRQIYPLMEFINDDEEKN